MAIPRVRHRAHHLDRRAKPRPPSRTEWRGLAVATLGLLTLVGKAVVVDCQAVKLLVEMWRHLHQIGS